MIRICSMLLGLCVMALVTATAGMAADQPKKMVGKHKEIHAVVEKVDAGVALFKEPDQMRRRTLSPAQLERMKLTDLKVGDAVSLIVDENNLIIDAHKTGMAGRGHQTLQGTFVEADNSGKTVKVKTSDGLKSLNVDSAAVSKVMAVKQGASVKVELDEAGTVIDIHSEN
jgi:hypothetical protein